MMIDRNLDEPNDIIDGAIIGTAEITPKILTNATVIT